MHQSWSSADSCSGISLRFIPFLHSFCLYPWNSLPLIYPCSVLKAASFQHSLLLHHLKNKQPLKFSHYLQFKVPTLLDGLQGLQEFCSADHLYLMGSFATTTPTPCKLVAIVFLVFAVPQTDKAVVNYCTCCSTSLELFPQFSPWRISTQFQTQLEHHFPWPLGV